MPDIANPNNSAQQDSTNRTEKRSALSVLWTQIVGSDASHEFNKSVRRSSSQERGTERHQVADGPSSLTLTPADTPHNLHACIRLDVTPCAEDDLAGQSEISHRRGSTRWAGSDQKTPSTGDVFSHLPFNVQKENLNQTTSPTEGRLDDGFPQHWFWRNSDSGSGRSLNVVDSRGRTECQSGQEGRHPLTDYAVTMVQKEQQLLKEQNMWSPQTF